MKNFSQFNNDLEHLNDFGHTFFFKKKEKREKESKSEKGKERKKREKRREKEKKDNERSPWWVGNKITQSEKNPRNVNYAN